MRQLGKNEQVFGERGIGRLEGKLIYKYRHVYSLRVSYQTIELKVLDTWCRLKGISVCFNMLKAALCGNYVNFGVFRLYGDSALDKALNMFVKLLLSIPLKNLLVSDYIIVHIDLLYLRSNITSSLCLLG